MNPREENLIYYIERNLGVSVNFLIGCSTEVENKVLDFLDKLAREEREKP